MVPLHRAGSGWDARALRLPRRALLTALGVLLTVAPARAQVDIEALRSDDPPLGRSGSLGGDLTVRTGNVDLIQLDLNGRHQGVSEGLTTLLVGSGGVGLLEGDRFSSSGLLHYRRTYRPRARLGPELYTQVNYDLPQLLTFRALAGAGARTLVGAGPRGQLSIGTSLMLEHERLDVTAAAAHPSETTVVRSSTFVSARIVATDRLVITSTTYVQPMVDRPRDLRVLETLRAAAPITESLALTVSFDLRYDSRPPGDIAALDTQLRTGVAYTY